jgi:RNA polymerase sigma factor (sigma-70 family)
MNDILIEEDRLTYNKDQRETRRHCSLNTYNADDNLIPSSENIEEFVCNADELKMAISSLSPDYQQLVRWYYFEDVPVEEIARRCGTGKPAVYRKLGRILEKMKKVFETM